MTPPTSPPRTPDAAAERFLRFNYPELKDLAKHFLTVVTATLVFSIAFAEKVINFQQSKPIAKLSLICSWILFAASIAFCGACLYVNFKAGEEANNSGIFTTVTDFRRLARTAYRLVDTALVLFFVGLNALIFSALGNLNPNFKDLSTGFPLVAQFLQAIWRAVPGVIFVLVLLSFLIIVRNSRRYPARMRRR